MEGWLLENGYPALFMLSFLASTVIPLGSEWLLAVLLTNGFEMSYVVPVATVGNTLGALTTYAIGLWGGPFLVRRVGGVLRTSFWKFLALVAVGKLLRYLVVAELVLQGIDYSLT